MHKASVCIPVLEGQSTWTRSLAKLHVDNFFCHHLPFQKEQSRQDTLKSRKQLPLTFLKRPPPISTFLELLNQARRRKEGRGKKKKGRRELFSSSAQQYFLRGGEKKRKKEISISSYDFQRGYRLQLLLGRATVPLLLQFQNISLGSPIFSPLSPYQNREYECQVNHY